MNDKNSFVFNYLNDKGTIFNSDSNAASTLESTIDINEGGPTYQFAWTGNLASNFLWTAQYGKRSVNNDIKVKGGDNPSRVLWESSIISGGNRFGSGNILLYYDTRTGNAAASIGRRPHEEFTSDVTWVKRLFGDHTVQGGVLIRPATDFTSRTTVPSSGTTVIDELLVGTTRVPFRKFTWDSSQFSESTRSTDQRGFYVQDKWQIHPRLTINFGSRFDNQRSFDILDRNLFNAWTFNPRLGFAFSFNKESRDVIRGSFGRYSDIIRHLFLPLSDRHAEFNYRLDTDFRSNECKSKMVWQGYNNLAAPLNIQNNFNDENCDFYILSIARLDFAF